MKQYHIKISKVKDHSEVLFEGVKPFRSFYAASNWAQKETHLVKAQIVEIKLVDPLENAPKLPLNAT